MMNSILEKLISNKRVIIVSIIALIALFFIYKYIKSDENLNPFKDQSEPGYSYGDGISKNDTLKKYGFYACENYIIKEDCEVRRTPNFAKFNTVYKLKFGTKVYTKNVDPKNAPGFELDPKLVARESKNEYVAIYAQKPVLMSDMPVGYIAKEDFVEKSEFKNFVPEPEIIKDIKVDPIILDAIAANSFIEEEEFQLTKDAKKIKSNIIKADFNNDDVIDVAVLLDNYNDEKSAVLIFFTNKETETLTLASKRVFPKVSKIDVLKKDTTILINSEENSFPQDAIIVKSIDSGSFILVIDTVDNSFMSIKI